MTINIYWSEKVSLFFAFFETFQIFTWYFHDPVFMPPAVIVFLGAYRNHPVCRSCKCNSALTDKPILLKLYTVAVFNLRMCLKEDNPCLDFFKGDN